MERKGDIINRVTIARSAAIHHQDQMMHPRNKQDSNQVLSGGLKNLNPHQKVTSAVIHIYF
jgi:hypothetical protein